MAMSKQEFIEMANFISKILNNIGKEWAFKLAVHMGEKFNPNFDYNKFSAACGSAARNETLKEIEREGLRAGGIKLISLTPLREEK